LSISKHVKSKEYQNFVLCRNAKIYFVPAGFYLSTSNFQRLSFVLLEKKRCVSYFFGFPAYSFCEKVGAKKYKSTLERFQTIV
jgi:hypothetical protein